MLNPLFWNLRRLLAETAPVPAVFEAASDFLDRWSQRLRCARASLQALAALPRHMDILESLAEHRRHEPVHRGDEVALYFCARTSPRRVSEVGRGKVLATYYMGKPDDWVLLVVDANGFPVVATQRSYPGGHSWKKP